MHPPIRLIASLALLASAAFAQDLKFEFTSVKVHPTPPGTYLIKNYPHAPPFIDPTSPNFADAGHLQDFIMEAYGVNEYQILYLPAQMRSREGVLYDIAGKAPGDVAPTPDQLEKMLQSLLADNFHLKAHWETKQKFTVYALVPDKTGPKFHEFQPDQAHETSAGAAFRGTTIFALAHFLTPNLDFPVIDGTGYGNKLFDFDIDSLVNFHEIDREQAADPLEAQDYLRSVVLHVLGLKLDQRKVDMKMLAIDHIEEPTAR